MNQSFFIVAVLSVLLPITAVKAQGDPQQQSGLWQLYQQQEQLIQEVRQLNGTVEEQAHQIRLLQEQVKAQYLDLDDRIIRLEQPAGNPLSGGKSLEEPSLVGQQPAVDQLEGDQLDVLDAESSQPEPVPVDPADLALPVQGAASKSLPSAGPSAVATSATATATATSAKTVSATAAIASIPAAPSPSPRQAPQDSMLDASFEAQKQAYEDAKVFVKERRLTESVDALKQLIVDYPQGAFVGYAHYWLGEVYLALDEPDEAQSEFHFNVVIDDHPDHPKTGATLFKLGKLYHQQNKPELAKQILKQAIAADPDGSVAELARNYLKLMD